MSAYVAAAAHALRRIAVARGISTMGNDAGIGAYRVRAVDDPDLPFEITHAPTGLVVARMLSPHHALTYARTLADAAVEMSRFRPHLRPVEPRAKRTQGGEA